MTVERNALKIERLRMIAYDLDGTLLDSIADIQRALNEALDQFGLEGYGEEDVKGFVGEGIGTLVRLALEGRGRPDLQDEALRAAKTFYQDHPAERAELFPDVAETLKFFRSRGIKQVIITNKPHEIALHSCASTGLTELVDLILGENNDHPLKPDPAMLKMAASSLGVDLAHCVMIGDGRADIRTAQEAGIPSVGVSWGMNARAEVEGYGPNTMIDSITELPGLLEPFIEPPPS